MRRPVVALLAPVLLLACAPEPPRPPPLPPTIPVAPASTVAAPTEPPPAPREDGRLPRLAVPLRYAVSLDVDPGQPRFSGRVRVLVRIPTATSHVVLNGRGLTVHEASATVGLDRINASVASRTSHGGHAPEELVLTFERPLEAGDAVLELAFDAPFDDSLAGLYRVKEGGRWYAFTQFEAADARRAFPCFDEPSFKVPFDVSITAPTGLLAFSNMPEATHAAAQGRTRFDFQTTPPLPSYLVAFVVGEFDVREASASTTGGPPGPKTPVPIRLITTKGKAGMGGLALSYFHIAYPYPKLDIVAVPDFAAGAMENAGLVTFREELLLLDPHRPPRDARIAQAETIAHELAHQWFGDLVTTAWWNDLWLNEGFATWAEAKIVERWQPSFRSRMTHLAALGDVMTSDSLRSARAVRQPVRSTGEAEEAFDGLTYDKGAAVLGMIEHEIGPDVFQRGVEAFLRANAWRTATADDLFRALDEASGTDVSRVAASFLDRPGVPSVTLGFDCTSRPPVVTMTQAPWRPFGGASGERLPAPTWLIPVDVATEEGGAARLLAERSGTASLAACPRWIAGNEEGFGYYRYELDERAWTALARALPTRSSAARLGFVTNLWAQVQAGTLGPEVLLRLLPVLDSEHDRVVIDAEIGVLSRFAHALVSDGARPAFARYVAARLEPHERSLAKTGPAGRRASDAGSPEDAALERRSIFSALGRLADDKMTLDRADRLARAWLADPTSVNADLAHVAVALASRSAAPERIDALRVAMKAAKNPSDRKTALVALAGFADPATLEKALEVTLSDDVPAQDVVEVIFEAAYRPATRARTFDWVIRRWEAIRAKLPAMFGGEVFGLVGQACTKGEVDRLSAFLSPRAEQFDGANRPFAQALEAATLCLALHERGASSVDRFFRVQPARK